MKKIRVGIIFGGRSAEHDVSRASAQSVIDFLDKEKYDITLLAINKTGEWYGGQDGLKLLNGEAVLSNPRARLALFDAIGGLGAVDVVFPVMHGSFGEDGTLQGLLEIFNIPYVGCNVLASSIGMDKAVQKQILRDAGFKVASWVEVRKQNFKKNPAAIYEACEKLGYPLFVKPACMGSSIGVHKAQRREELVSSIADAFRYDDKILAERAISGAREIECAILGNEEPRASVLGEIAPANEFYDYDAKYISGKSLLKIPAELPGDKETLIRAAALKVFGVLNCSGLARVDFLVETPTLDVFVNEINTLPGFTPISMYPKLWEASGLGYSELLDELINLAVLRHKNNNLILRTL